MSNIKLPPIFNPDEDDNYCVWKNDVELGQPLVKEKPKRQGLAAYFSLTERARGILINDLKKDNGVEEIMRILDEIFQSNETKQAYHAFREYVEYSDQWSDFFIICGRIWEKIQKSKALQVRFTN